MRSHSTIKAVRLASLIKRATMSRYLRAQGERPSVATKRLRVVTTPFNLAFVTFDRASRFIKPLREVSFAFIKANIGLLGRLPICHRQALGSGAPPSASCRRSCSLNYATIDAKLTREAKYCRAFGELLADGLSLIFRQTRQPSWETAFRLGARKPGLRPLDKQVTLEFSHGGNDAPQHLAGARR
jgi:hypothetical protein